MKTGPFDPRLFSSGMTSEMSSGVSAPQVKPNNKSLEAAATEFEALFFQQMLKGMRQAGDVLAEDNPFNSQEQSFVRDWHDSELARKLAADGGIGLAEQLIRQVEVLQGEQPDPDQPDRVPQDLSLQ